MPQPQFTLPGAAAAATAVATATPHPAAPAAPPAFIVGTNLQQAHNNLAAVTGVATTTAGRQVVSTGNGASTNSVRVDPLTH